MLELPDVGDPPEAVAEDEDDYNGQAHLHTQTHGRKITPRITECGIK